MLGVATISGLKKSKKTHPQMDFPTSSDVNLILVFILSLLSSSLFAFLHPSSLFLIAAILIDETTKYYKDRRGLEP